MRGSDPPAVGGAHPGLHLAAELAGRGRAAEERGGDGEVAAEGGDHGARERAGEALRRARGAEGGDLDIAIEVLRRAVPDGSGGSEKETVERGDIVGDERALVGGEGGLDLGFDVGNVYLQARLLIAPALPAAP